jgi:hypothetical protein
VGQLVTGCSELLLPASNCSVEWRSGAVSCISGAVQQFLSDHPGKRQTAPPLAVLGMRTSVSTVSISG